MRRQCRSRAGDPVEMEWYSVVAMTVFAQPAPSYWLTRSLDRRVKSSGARQRGTDANRRSGKATRERRCPLMVLSPRGFSADRKVCARAAWR
jgi:hypothetical protein